VRSSYKSTSKDLSLEKMIREGGGPLSRTLAMVEEEEGTVMMVVEARERMIQTST